MKASRRIAAPFFSAAMAIPSVEIGPRATDAVIRIGSTGEPFVLTGIDDHDGSRWIRLDKKCRSLSKLLSGKVWGSPLKHCAIFGDIYASQRQAVAELRRAASTQGAASTQEDGSAAPPGDKVAQLDLGDVQAETPMGFETQRVQAACRCLRVASRSERLDRRRRRQGGLEVSCARRHWEDWAQSGVHGVHSHQRLKIVQHRAGSAGFGTARSSAEEAPGCTEAASC